MISAHFIFIIAIIKSYYLMLKKESNFLHFEAINWFSCALLRAVLSARGILSLTVTPREIEKMNEHHDVDMSCIIHKIMQRTNSNERSSDNGLCHARE